MKEDEPNKLLDGLTVDTRGCEQPIVLDGAGRPIRMWRKLSPTDLASLDRWDEYTGAKVDRFRVIDRGHAPWTLVKSNDRRRDRLETMRSLLSRSDYARKDAEAFGTPDVLIVGVADTLLEPGEENAAVSRTPVFPRAGGPGNHSSST